jgi:hypothetical protein
MLTLEQARTAALRVDDFRDLSEFFTLYTLNPSI